MTPHQETQRYIVTAADLVMELYLDPHPDLRRVGARKTLEKANEALFHTSLKAGDVTKAEVIGSEVRKLCRILGNAAVVLRKAPEAPLDHYMAALAACIQDLEDCGAGAVTAASKRAPVDPPSLALRASINQTLCNQYGVPHDALPRARHWMRINADLARSGGCDVTTCAKLDAKAHVGLPQMGGIVVAVYDGPWYVMTSRLEYAPGESFFLQADIQAVVDQQRTASSDGDMEDSLRAGLRDADPRFTVIVNVGAPEGDLSGQRLLNLDISQVIDVEYPAKDDPGFAGFVTGLGQAIAKAFGSRGQNTERARDVANSCGLQFVDVQMTQSSARYWYTCGMSVWWKMPAALPISVDALTTMLRSFIRGIGNVYDGYAGVPLFQDARNLADRVQAVLDNQDLELSDSTREAMTVVLQAATNNDLDRVQTEIVVPARLDFVERFSRKATTEIATPTSFKAAWKQARPILAQNIRNAHNAAIAAGVPRASVLPAKDILERLAFQAKTDMDVYKRVPGPLTVRVGHADFSVDDRVVGRFYHPTCSVNIANRQGALEYEVEFP